MKQRDREIVDRLAARMGGVFIPSKQENEMNKDDVPEWRSIESAPEVGTWCVGRLSGEGRPPAFVGKVYDNPFPDMKGKLTLIDEWTGKWKVVTGWMPLPAPPEPQP